MFKPKAIYFENKILEYPLGKKLMEKYKNTGAEAPVSTFRN